MSDQKADYGLDSLKVLSDIEHVRKRTGMYVGDPENPYKLFDEAFDNSLDEVQSGHSSGVYVSVNNQNDQYTIKDFGRGIPVGIVEFEQHGVPIKMEALKLLSTVLKSGAKFDNDSYRLRTGLNGVGMVCINALSEYARFETRRNDKKVVLETNNGEVVNLEYGTADEHSGVTVTFRGDPTIFPDTKIPLQHITDRCKIAKAFGFGTELYVDGEYVDLEVNSLLDVIPADDSETSVYSTIELEAKIRTGEFVKVAMKYTSDTKDKYFGYTNLLNNRYGGTHVNMAYDAIVNGWKRFRDGCSIGGDIELKDADYVVGLRCLVAVFISNPSFSSQTKEKLSVKKDELKDLMDALESQVVDYLRNHQEVARALIKRFEEYREAQNKLTSRKEIASLVKVNNQDSGESNYVRRRSVVTKLAECISSEREGSELYIVEGDSAAGPAKRARNRFKQAVLPIRGKILNVVKYITWGTKLVDILQNGDVCNIINSVGAGVQDDADPKRSRYERIMIAADADPDGKHIDALLLGIMVNLLGPLVRSGMVYVVLPPLYGFQVNGEFHTCDVYNEIPEGATHFTRYKGLGEMDDDEFSYCCMNEETRRAVKVHYPTDIDKFNHILSTSDGKSDLLKELGIVKDLRDHSIVKWY